MTPGYYKLYILQYLVNRIEGYPVRYINILTDVFKKAIAKFIKFKEVQDGGHNAEVYNGVCMYVGCL